MIILKNYIAIFIVSFVCFTLILFMGMNFIFADSDNNVADGSSGSDVIEVVDPSEPENEVDKEPVDERTELEKLVDDSSRVNVVVFGIDGERADTIMLVSYDPDNQLMDVISVPRDTYYHYPGYDRKDQKKINAVYGYRTDGGSEGMKRAVSETLGIPVDNYVKVKYSSVKDIVDLIGGVEVNIPFKMDYDDPYCSPELHIHFEPGVQTLYGQDAIEYLRFRKNNDGTHDDGDLARIKRQQDFAIKAVKKSIGPKLPQVITTAYSFVKTDMELGDMLYYGSKAIGFDTADISTYQLPGEWDGTYIRKDAAAAEQMLIDIYSKQ